MQRWQPYVAAVLLAGSLSLSSMPAFSGAVQPVDTVADQHQSVTPGPRHGHRGHGDKYGRALKLIEEDPARAQQWLAHHQDRLTERHQRVQGALARVQAELAGEKDTARRAVLTAQVDVARAKLAQLEKQQLLVQRLLTLAAERSKAGTGR